MYYIYFVYRNIVDLNVGQQCLHRGQTISKNEWSRESRGQCLSRSQLDLVQGWFHQWNLSWYFFCKDKINVRWFTNWQSKYFTKSFLIDIYNDFLFKTKLWVLKLCHINQLENQIANNRCTSWYLFLSALSMNLPMYTYHYF